jgi:putative hemolysin
MDTTLLISLTASLLLSFLLSGLESAILAIGPARLHHAAKEGGRRARLVENLLTRRELLLGSILLINAAVNLMAFALITAETVGWFGMWGYLIASVVSLPVYLIWVELLPKAIFRRTPLRLLCFFSPILFLIDITVRPWIQLLALPGSRLANRLSATRSPPPGGTREEFRAYTEILERDGTLSPRETRMIRSVLDFQLVRVKDVMRPLSRVTAAPPEMPVSSIIALARQTGIDQFPLMAPNGDLIGVVDALELLKNRVSTGPAQQYRHSLVRSAPSESAIAVIRRLRRAGHQIAAVCNPAGRPIGIVSVADLVEKMIEMESSQLPSCRSGDTV